MCPSCNSCTSIAVAAHASRLTFIDMMLMIHTTFTWKRSGLRVVRSGLGEVIRSLIVAGVVVAAAAWTVDAHIMWMDNGQQQKFILRSNKCAIRGAECAQRHQVLK